MYQQPQSVAEVADHNVPVQRSAEKGSVNVGDKDGEESSLERLMQEKDGDTSMFTAMSEVAEALAQHQIEASAPVEKLEPSNYTYPPVSPPVVYPNPIHLVYLQPTQTGLSIIPCQVAGQPPFIPHYPSGLHDNLQHPVVAQPGAPFPVPPHSIYDGLYSYNPSTFPSYESTNLLPHVNYDQSRMNQPLHTPASPLPYPVNGVINPLPYPVSVQTNLASYPSSIPTPSSSPYPNLTPYAVYPPTNAMPYPHCGYGPINQGRITNTPHYFDHESSNNVVPVPVTYQDTGALSPTTSVVKSTVEKRFFRPWEEGGEMDDCHHQWSEEEELLQFGEEDFPALNQVFDKMKIKN